MASKPAKVRFVEEGLSKIERRFGRFSSRLDSFGSRAAAVGKKVAKAFAVAFAAAAAATAAFIVKSVQKFRDFDKSMREVFTLLPGISGDAMRQMEDQVLDLSNKMNVLPEEVVPALYQSLSAGIPQDNVFAFLETAVKTSKAGVAELEPTVKILAAIVNAYGMEAADAAEVSDILFTTVKQGVTTIPELSSALAQVLPIAAANNVSLGQLSGWLSTLTKGGTPTAQAVTQIRSAITELSKAGKPAFEAFEQAAGITFPLFMQEGGTVAGAMAIMEQAAADAGVPVQDLFGTIEGGLGVLGVTGKNLKTLEGDLAGVKDAAGATDAAYETMAAGMDESFASLRTAFDVLMIKVGREFAPLVQGVADDIDANSEEISDAVITMAQVIADGVKIALDALIEVGKVISDVRGIVEGDAAAMSAAVHQHLGVEMPDTLNASRSDLKRWEQTVDDASKDSIKSWSDLIGTITSDTLTFGQKFGLIWSDLWHETEREKTNVETATLRNNETWLGRMLSGAVKWDREFRRVWGQLWERVVGKQTESRSASFGVQESWASGMLSRFDTFARKNLLAWARWLERIRSDLAVRLFALHLMWLRWTGDVSKTVSGWGSRFVQWWAGLPGRITGAIGDIAGKIKQKFSSLLKGFSIPIKLAFGGDGLGMLPGAGGGGLMGAGGAVASAYTALGRPGSVISGFRPGSRTLSGNLSYHALRRALDITPIRSIAVAIRSMFGSRTKELITPWRELDLHNGRPHYYSAGVHAQHSGSRAHIHWAMRSGGVAPGGWTLLGEEGPELVNLPPGAQVMTARHSEQFMSARGWANGDGPGWRPPPGYQAAVAELLRRVRSGKSVFEDFSYRGMSRNLARFNDEIAARYHRTHRGGTFTHASVSRALRSYMDASPPPRASSGGGSKGSGTTIINVTVHAGMVADKARLERDLARVIRKAQTNHGALVKGR